MLAWKFLAEGAVGPYSKFVWPMPQEGAPGPWVAAEDSLSPCAQGIHACHGDGLSSWLAAELWLIELDGRIERHRNKIVAERGRLHRRVEAWNRETFGAFGQACILQARHLALDALRAEPENALATKLAHAQSINDIVRALEGQRGGNRGAALAIGYLLDALAFLEKEPAVAAFCAAHAALSEESFWRERAWQSQWIVNRLGLDTWIDQ